MNNEELAAIRSVFREEMGTVSTVLREEIATVNTTLRAEIATVNTTLREEIATVRQELGSLEQRINVRFDAVEHRLDNVEHRLDNVEHRLDLHGHQLEFMREHLIQVASGQRELRSDFQLMQKNFADMQEEQHKVIIVLDEVVTKVAEVRDLQFTLEAKFNDFQGMSRRDMQNLERRMTAHENTPLDRAHPRSFPPL